MHIPLARITIIFLLHDFMTIFLYLDYKLIFVLLCDIFYILSIQSTQRDMESFTLTYILTVTLLIFADK